MLNVNLNNINVNANPNVVITSDPELPVEKFEQSMEIFETYTQNMDDNNFTYYSTLRWLTKISIGYVFGSILYRNFNGMSEKGEAANEAQELDGMDLAQYFMYKLPLGAEEQQTQLLEMFQDQYERKAEQFKPMASDKYVLQAIKENVSFLNKHGIRHLPKSNKDLDKFMALMESKHPDVYNFLHDAAKEIYKDKVNRFATAQASCETAVAGVFENMGNSSITGVSQKHLYYMVNQIVNSLDNAIIRNEDKEAYFKRNDATILECKGSIQDILDTVIDLSERTDTGDIDNGTTLDDRSHVRTDSEIAQHAYQDATGQEKHLACT